MKSGLECKYIFSLESLQHCKKIRWRKDSALYPTKYIFKQVNSIANCIFTIEYFRGKRKKVINVRKQRRWYCSVLKMKPQWAWLGLCISTTKTNQYSGQMNQIWPIKRNPMGLLNVPLFCPPIIFQSLWYPSEILHTTKRPRNITWQLSFQVF